MNPPFFQSQIAEKILTVGFLKPVEPSRRPTYGLKPREIRKMVKTRSSTGSLSETTTIRKCTCAFEGCVGCSYGHKTTTPKTPKPKSPYTMRKNWFNTRKIICWYGENTRSRNNDDGKYTINKIVCGGSDRNPRGNTITNRTLYPRSKKESFHGTCHPQTKRKLWHPFNPSNKRYKSTDPRITAKVR